MNRTNNRLAASAAAMALGLTLAANWNPTISRAQTAPPASTADTAASPAAKPVLQTSGTWVIDPAHTNVNFAVGHLGISTVRGRFDDVAGSIVADAEKPANSSVKVTIKTASINTGVKMRDDHLRSADFFDAAKHPEITFVSTRIEEVGNGGFVAHGNLSMHGVTRPIALPFKVAGPIPDRKAGARIGIETQVRLNRQDYGIKYGQVLENGALAITNDVDVTISLEAVPAPPATAD